MATNTTPWGYPAQPPSSDWLTQYGPLLMVAGLLLLGVLLDSEKK